MAREEEDQANVFPGSHDFRKECSPCHMLPVVETCGVKELSSMACVYWNLS